MTEVTMPSVSALLQPATDLVSSRNAVSISLLQRHFRLGYQAGIELAELLEKAQIITAPSSDGFRALTPKAQAMRQSLESPSVNELFEAWAIDPHEGGDGGDPGTPESPSIWMFGIEHGDGTNLEQEEITSREGRDYSVDKQLIYPYNRQAFKLLAAIQGETVSQYEKFARLHQPWVPGSKGYFKGNLYPYPCRCVNTWPEQAQKETGFERKEDIIKWCNEYRLPAIAEAVHYHRPKLFIGVGASNAAEFSRAYFGSSLPLEEHKFVVNGHSKKIRYAKHNRGVLVVIPHLTGGANGLNSDESIQIAGSFIAGLMT